MPSVSKEQVAAAQAVSVYEYACAELAEHFVREGNGLRLRSDHKVFVSAGATRYFDNGTGLPGNCIDLLTRHFGVTFVAAVEALCGYAGAAPQAVSSVQKERPIPHNIVLPQPASGGYRAVFAYLQGRGIPAAVIQRLVDLKLLYQSAEHNNAVFVNTERTYAEIRGTYTQSDRPFKQSLGAKAGNCWVVPSLDAADTVFVCEGAIDAVSLAVLRTRAGLPGAVYASIGGVGNTGAIDKLVTMGKTVIIATDADEAGESVRIRYPDLAHIIPHNKDWNEDLKKGCTYDDK